MNTFPLLGGQLLLEDTPPRPTEDPLWLAATMPPLPNGSRVLDAACGSGLAGLALHRHQPHIHLEALDIDPTLTALATRNAALNHIPLTTHTHNLLTPSYPHILTPYDAILCNPPYHGEERGHTTPNLAKRQAHTLPAQHLTIWLEALSRLLTPSGTLHLILHTACEAELTTFAASRTLHLTYLQTSSNRPPKRLLATLQNGKPHIVRHPNILGFEPKNREKTLGQIIKKV